MIPEEILEGLLNSSKASLFQNRTVKELLWGYRDPIFYIKTGLFVSVSTKVVEGHAQTSNREQ